MHVPTQFAFTDQRELFQFITHYSFAQVTSSDLQSTYMPLIAENAAAHPTTLLGHFAKGNPHHRNLSGQQVLISFNGPHSYISPTWYASGPNVPTWNYVAVHVKANARTLSAEQTAKVIDDMLSFYEPELLTLKRDEDEQRDYHNKLLNGIVGVAFDITEIQGVRKLGQHKSKDDQGSVFSQLQQNEHGHELANYMRQHNIGKGTS